MVHSEVPEETPARQWREGAVVLLTALAFTAVMFAPLVFSADALFERDVLRASLPVKHFWAERVAAGRLPQWMPYDGLGQPFLGMVTPGTFHVLNLLYLIFPMDTAFKWNVLVCFPLAFVGTYLFARRWTVGRPAAMFAAAAFSFCGYLVSASSNLHYLMAAASLPLALWTADRFVCGPAPGSALAAGLAGASVLFCGDPQAFAVCLAAILGLGAVRARPGAAAPCPHRLWLAFALVAGVVAVSACQLLPGIAVRSEGWGGARSLFEAEYWSLGPRRLLEMVAGPFWTARLSPRQTWEVSSAVLGYQGLWSKSLLLGPATVGFALVALLRSRKGMAYAVLALAAGGLWALAMGRHTPLYGWLYGALPAWRVFRFPEKLVPHLCLAVALAAGVGLEGARRDERTRRIARGVLLGMAGLALGVVSLLASGLWHPAPPAGMSADSLAAVLQNAQAFGAQSAGVLVGIVLAWSSSRPWLAAYAPLGLSFAFAAASQQSAYLTADRSVMAPSRFEREVEAPLGARRVYSAVDGYPAPEYEGAEGWRVVSHDDRAALLPDIPSLDDVETANFYLPAFTWRVRALSLDRERWFFRYATLFNVSHLVVRRDWYRRAGLPEVLVRDVEPSADLALIENPEPLPRAFFALPRWVPGPDEALRALQAEGFRGDREAIVEGAPRAGGSPATAGAVKVVRYEPELVELESRSDGAGVVVLSDTAFRGWRATVDGADADILTTNFAVRGVLVEGGEHRIRFSYRAPGMVPGAATTAATLLLVGAWALARRRTSRDGPVDGS